MLYNISLYYIYIVEYEIIRCNVTDARCRTTWATGKLRDCLWTCRHQFLECAEADVS